jgi:hypothetical protein
MDQEPEVAPWPPPEPDVVDVEPIPEPEVAPPPPEPDVVDVEPIPEPEPTAPVPEPEALAPEPEPPAPEPEPPAHLDAEPELVAEYAEPGAEEGAHAEIHVDEPWDGYRRMRVADVRDRVAVASPEELAVIQLYESTHRKRRTVLEAVDRRSKELANRPPAG